MNGVTLVKRNNESIRSTVLKLPRIGIGLPTFGPFAIPDAIVTVATAVERLGFHAVSASERLLLPAAPDWVNAAGLPEHPVYDPIEALTWAAAHTRRIRLGTGIVNSLFQSPIVLARRLATLDQLSRGRLDVGIGQGWMEEEFIATGVPMRYRGTGFEEHLAAMRACWAADPVEHHGPRYRIPISRIGPKPFQEHLPVWIGALAQPAVERAARVGDGFITALRSWDTTRDEIAWYRAAGGTGSVVLRMGLDPIEPTAPSTHVVSSMIANLVRAGDAGIDELHWDLTLSGFNAERQVELLEALASSLPSFGETSPESAEHERMLSNHAANA